MSSVAGPSILPLPILVDHSSSSRFISRAPSKLFDDFSDTCSTYSTPALSPDSSRSPTPDRSASPNDKGPSGLAGYDLLLDAELFRKSRLFAKENAEIQSIELILRATIDFPYVNDVVYIALFLEKEKFETKESTMILAALDRFEQLRSWRSHYRAHQRDIKTMALRMGKRVDPLPPLLGSEMVASASFDPSTPFEQASDHTGPSFTNIPSSHSAPVLLQNRAQKISKARAAARAVKLSIRVPPSFTHPSSVVVDDKTLPGATFLSYSQSLNLSGGGPTAPADSVPEPQGESPFQSESPTNSSNASAVEFSPPLEPVGNETPASTPEDLSPSEFTYPFDGVSEDFHQSDFAKELFKACTAEPIEQGETKPMSRPRHPSVPSGRVLNDTNLHLLMEKLNFVDNPLGEYIEMVPLPTSGSKGRRSSSQGSLSGSARFWIGVGQHISQDGPPSLKSPSSSVTSSNSIKDLAALGGLRKVSHSHLSLPYLAASSPSAVFSSRPSVEPLAEAVGTYKALSDNAEFPKRELHTIHEERRTGSPGTSPSTAVAFTPTNVELPSEMEEQPRIAERLHSTFSSPTMDIPRDVITDSPITPAENCKISGASFPRSASSFINGRFTWPKFKVFESRKAVNPSNSSSVPPLPISESMTIANAFVQELNDATQRILARSKRSKSRKGVIFGLW